VWEFKVEVGEDGQRVFTPLDDNENNDDGGGGSGRGDDVRNSATAIGQAEDLIEKIASTTEKEQPCAYVNPKTNQTFPLNEPIWSAPEQTPLMLTPLPGINREQIKTHVRSIWRYAASFPSIPCPEPITLGEGCTPLVAKQFKNRKGKVHFKCEWFNPTSSFKDRGTSVMLSLLRAQGVTKVLEDSSGNGGASVACYAAAGGLSATIMCPSATSPAKTVAMRAYGASVELIPGPRQATADEAVKAHGRDGMFYASHAWHPFFLQGTKTMAYELWEDLGFAAPDNVIIPTGGGSNVMGCDIGFSELVSSGEISKLPRLFMAQPANSCPIVSAFHDTEPSEWKPTLAEGTAIARPVRQAEVVAALRRSNGGAVAASEEDIAAATLVCVEPKQNEQKKSSGMMVQPSALLIQSM
jgi:threonine synthase